MLLVKETGSKSWVQRITIRGHRRDIGLGPYPVVGLSQAREKAMENKRSVQRGEDPLAAKRRSRASDLNRMTFAAAATFTCSELSSSWKSVKEPKAFLSSLQTYVFPYFGDVDICDVTSADVRRTILLCRKKVPNLATKVQHRILSVFKYAVAEGLRPDNPATADALALPKLEKRTTHYRALPYSEVAKAIEAVRSSGAWVCTKLSLEFVVLTACRSGEVRGARWHEFDLEAATWTIPAVRMKMNREHRVPLCPAALVIVRSASCQRGNSQLLFPSITGKELSDSTLSKLLRELGVKSTVHGFRSSFRTWAQEHSDASEEVAEAALAHFKGDKTFAAYARSDLFVRRRNLMNAWAEYLEKANIDVDAIGVLRDA